MSAIDGYTFLQAATTEPPSIWGGDAGVAWSSGEPMMVVAPQGTGKTTIAQQLVMARLGIGRPLLGMNVEHNGRLDRVLYIAADRPKQIARSWNRMIEPSDLPELRDRLVVWRGPLEFDIGRETGKLAELAQAHDVQTVVVDSLKDVAVDLVKDETGGRVNQSFQHVVAAGIELVVLHHQRKGQNGQRPRTLEDVYGSTWLTAGCGSVILLWGQAGDPVVELDHLKQPSDPVGPLKILHDHQTGLSSLYETASLVELLRSAGEMTPRSAAAVIFGTSDPTTSEVEKARRKLKQLVERGQAVEHSSGAPAPTVYRANSRFDSRETHGTHADPLLTRPPLRGGPRVSTHGQLTAPEEDGGF